jgi:hypothetical protein
MPLGLDHAHAMRAWFDTPVLASVAGNSSITSGYDLFVSSVPAEWTRIEDVRRSRSGLVIWGDHGEEINLGRLRSFTESGRECARKPGFFRKPVPVLPA